MIKRIGSLLPGDVFRFINGRSTYTVDYYKNINGAVFCYYTSNMTGMQFTKDLTFENVDIRFQFHQS